jgi:hypothetical protein
MAEAFSRSRAEARLAKKGDPEVFSRLRQGGAHAGPEVIREIQFIVTNETPPGYEYRYGPCFS